MGDVDLYTMASRPIMGKLGSPVGFIILPSVPDRRKVPCGDIPCHKSRPYLQPLAAIDKRTGLGAFRKSRAALIRRIISGRVLCAYRSGKEVFLFKT